ncbi:hypothetical protein ACFLZR_01705 [Candidatus Neomarinimicrobiota bacterium]
MIRYRQKMIILALGGSMLLWAGCRDKLTPETRDYVEYGWELFLEGEYREAVEQFEIGVGEEDGGAQYADGWNGIGWSYARLGAADTSKTNFTRGVALADTSEVGTDVLSGRAFANLALGVYVDAVSDGKAALVRDATWTFSRDATVTFEHLVLTVAEGFYGLGEYDSSYTWVRKLESTFSLGDPSSLAGRAELADKIEELDDLI